MSNSTPTLKIDLGEFAMAIYNLEKHNTTREAAENYATSLATIEQAMMYLQQWDQAQARLQSNMGAMYCLQTEQSRMKVHFVEIEQAKKLLEKLGGQEIQPAE